MVANNRDFFVSSNPLKKAGPLFEVTACLLTNTIYNTCYYLQSNWMVELHALAGCCKFTVVVRAAAECE